MDRALAQYRRSKGVLGAHARYFEQISSTNNWLVEQGAQGAPEGLVALAEFQTSGRGRLGRRWEAPSGTCLLLSLLFRPPAPFEYVAPRLTMVCGMALLDAVAGVAAVPLALKWPNDLIVEPDGAWRKVAGMLSEVGMVAQRPDFLVIGIGVNVNVPAEALAGLAPNASSLLVETGHTIDRVPLLDSFLERTEALYQQLRAGWDPRADWIVRLAWIGHSVQVHTPDEIITGVAEGVDEAGALILRLPSGLQRCFAVGDVTLRAS
jgi:BirA family transcriptional regulator, biotin operon repressor / biotin---[acetyl-CoA-carboxylase] ligase